MSAGPNLLAWAREVAAVADKYFDADSDIFRLARAILADEEERKRTVEYNFDAEAVNKNFEKMVEGIYGPKPETSTE